MNIQFMTDGGADIPEHFHEIMDIIIVPLYLHFKDGEYKTGNIDMTTFFQKNKRNK